MSSIAFIHSGKSFLPEIQAYQNYFESNGVHTVCLINPSQFEMLPYDILWFFMGIQYSLNKKNKIKFIVHEYCSASTPPFARGKDFVKRIVNPIPDLRVTLTSQHRGSVFPSDNVPLITRRQGIHSCFFDKVDYLKEYDFIYTGSALKIRDSSVWLNAFLDKFPGSKIVMTGNHEQAITKQFRSKSNIDFKGPVTIESLPSLLSKARFAVNYVPDIYPFNVQPSTKFLEYCAAGCSVISNKYKWVNEFSQTTIPGIFFINNQFDNLSAKNLEQYHFDVPDMTEYKWKNIFEEMQLPKYLPV